MTSPITASASPGRAAITKARFILTAVLTSVLNLLLHAATYVLVLKDFYRAHPAGTEEFVRQLNRPADQLVVWAMVVTALTMGLFITTVMSWSGAKTLLMGLKQGAILGFLFWTAVNSGLYASSNMFSLPSVLVDTPLSALAMMFSATFAAWLLNRGRDGGAPHEATQQA